MMPINKKEDIDFIIVGSGPGGATVAKELSLRKKKVCILEWGDNNPLTGSFRYGARTMLIPGKSMLFTSQLLVHSGSMGIAADGHNYWPWKTFGKTSYGL